MKLLNYRLLSFLGFLTCAFGMGFALWIQSLGYEPCPFCIFQRVAMITAGFFFLIAAAIGPKGAGWRWLLSAFPALAAITGAGIAARHVWLQSLPEDQVPACGPSLDYLMQVMPLSDVVSTVLRGDGNCAKIDVAFMGIALPGWTLMAFIGLAALALLTPLLARRRASDLL